MKQKSNMCFLLYYPGGYPRDVTSNIPVLNIADNWPHMSTGSHGMLGQSSTTAPQSQYGMWSMGGHMGNLSPNQNCAMPYLRSSAPYTLCNSTTTVASVPNVTISNSVPTSSFESCDISPFSSNRDAFKNNGWGPLSPPPI